MRDARTAGAWSSSVMNGKAVWEACRSGKLPLLLSLSFAFAAITGVSAQLRLYLPFTPVPVTAQVLAVLLSGVCLGPAFGALSQLLYVALGAAGIPWFVLGPIGPTGGYLVGFVIAPAIVGCILRRGTGCRRPSYARALLAMLAGIAAVYTLGLVQFSLFTRTGIADAIRLAVLPFIPFDALKALLASLAARRMSGTKP